jgi:zinc/manganese transport system substrate-binding protein/manganese/iron transport system substrate-binding protein
VTVVATTTQVADFVRNVGGRRVDVHQILHPNADPH